jgi:hypothetical protein
VKRLDVGAHLGSGREAGQADSWEILPAHVYHNEEERLYRLLMGSVLFRLVAHPLQPRVVGPYPVWVVWFPSRLLLEETDHIQNFGP